MVAVSHRRLVHITAVVTTFTTATGRKHLGVCTNWLARQIPTEDYKPVVPVFMQKAHFHLPENPLTPIIMVGPGTGLAPFRGFLQERALSHAKGVSAQNLLFFGCRSAKVDFIYERELRQAENDGCLKLFLAFSRDQAQKMYVQHQITAVADLIWSVLFEQGGIFYVCGDARAMAKEVYQALQSIVVQKANKTEEEANQLLTDLQKSGKYLTDIWF